VRIVDISDQTKPKILSDFLTDQNTNCNESASADPGRFPRRGPSSHLGKAWGTNLYFMAWYGAGLQVIDIEDPYHPVEAGYFTYDVIFGPGGFLYLPDGAATPGC
jgi:hypothetical protein